MSLKCKHADCDPEFTQCLLGETLATCKNIHRKGNSDQDEPEEAKEADEKVPWSGNTLGTKNLHLIAARNSAIMIGLVGPHDSGKTTYLALLFRCLMNGKRIGDLRFAGSFTLAAWEAISSGFRWPQQGSVFCFPAHTSLNEKERVPGLLHLALRDSSGRIHDLLFTDAPGEWFTEWSTNKVNDRAEGARWIHQRANAFLVFADAARMGGENRGPAREEVNRMLQRLGDGLDKRPLAIAWSKADLPISDNMKEQIKREAMRISPDFTSFEISHLEAYLQNYTDSTTWLLTQAIRPQPISIAPPHSKSNDFFFHIR